MDRIKFSGTRYNSVYNYECELRNEKFSGILGMSSLRVLLLEDSEDDSLLVIRHLKRAGYDLEAERVETAPAMQEALDTRTWDVILSDYSMPQFGAPQALAVLKERNLDIPFIIVSGTIGEETAVAALLAGASDFLIKGNLSRLVPAIERELREAQERQKRREAEAELRRAEERFEKAFRANPAGISITTYAEGRFIDVNDGMLKMLGYEREEVIGHTSVELGLWHSGEQRYAAASVLTDAANSHDLELGVRTKSGELRYLWVAREMIDLGGQQCILAMAHDLTERKRAENLMARYNERLTTLHAIDQLILTAQSDDAVIALVLRYFIQQLQLPAASIATFDLRSQESFIHTVIRHRDDDQVESTRSAIDGWSLEDISELQTNEAQLIENTTDVSQLPPELRLLQGGQIYTFLRLPLMAQGELIGTLCLASDSANTFTVEFREIAHEIAAQVGIAIHQARLRDQIHRHALELESRVVERTSELQQAKEHVEAILNSTGDAIVFLTIDGTIQQVNRAFTELFGYLIEEVWGQSIFILAAVNDAETCLNALTNTVNTGQPSRVDFRGLRKDGGTFVANLALVAIRQNGKIDGLVMTVHDITLRIEAEEELRQALEKERELNELKSRFVSMISHEFRTPLTAILSSSEILKRYHDRFSADRRVDYLDRIGIQVQRLTNLLEDVLTLGKADVVGFKFAPMALDLGGFCRDLVEEIQVITKSPHQIMFSVGGHCAGFVGDDKLLRHIITNLLINSIKYSPESDKIELYLDCEPNHAIIRISDTGMGIPEEDQKYLFVPFHRATNVGQIPGTGLGLPIVKRAVDAHGGTITCESAVGVGTTFTITIPLRP